MGRKAPPINLKESNISSKTDLKQMKVIFDVFKVLIDDLKYIVNKNQFRGKKPED